jgi:hypothetical protein
LERAVQRALRGGGGGGGDELALKALRALASSGNAALAAKLASHAPGLVALLQAPGASADAQTEVLGVLAAAFDTATGACCADADAVAGQAAAIAGGKSAAAECWDAALASTRAVRAVAACLASPIGDDALLEAVALIGSIAGRPAMAKQLAESGAVRFGVCALHCFCIKARASCVTATNKSCNAPLFVNLYPPLCSCPRWSCS